MLLESAGKFGYAFDPASRKDADETVFPRWCSYRNSKANRLHTSILILNLDMDMTMIFWGAVSKKN